MSQLVTITSVIGPGTPWSNDYGTYHPFVLTVDETAQPIEVNRKPDSALLEAGQQVWVETKPGRNGALRGKIVQPPDQPPQQATGGQQRMGGETDPTRRSIERQCCLKAAVEYESARNGLDSTSVAAPIDVVETAELFWNWVSQS